MNFLEAHKIVSTFSGGPPLPFLFATSGMSDNVHLFLKAAAAKRGRSAEIRTLPFNTLAQTLLSSETADAREVFLLLPWDLVPEADWRSGLPAASLDPDATRLRARQIVDRLARRSGARMVYIRAPMPPLFGDPATMSRLDAWLVATLADAGAEILPPTFFSLSSYLASGSPVASSELGALAEKAIACALGDLPETKKVLVTDLDNVMWRGIIGEDGPDGIQYAGEGGGFRHFVYQTFLAKLKREGALLAAVSRNDADLANAPFRSGRMALQSDDFVVIVASYKAKSAQIREIARQLNLGLDSFVFVDDNPIELEEVGGAIPEIRTVRFPDADDALPEMLAQISALFARQVVTAEDNQRTAMYRRRLEGMMPVETEGADITGFLRGLDMSLTIHDRTRGDRTRAVQLINKTNQFNLNGRRVTEEEVGDLLASGGRLYTCSLSDRTGSHGEILSCLIDDGGTIQSFVMSCRVFQRRVEHAFVAWLGSREDAPTTLAYAATPRNEPMHQFLDDPAFVRDGDVVVADLSAFAQAHAGDGELFALTVASGGDGEVLR